MGKGGGCVPSKKKLHVDVANQDPPLPQPNSPISSAATQNPTTSSITETSISKNGTESIRKLKIFIIFYSMYCHVELLARRMKKGVDSIDGVEGFLFQVPETLPMEVLEQMQVTQKGNEVPLISANDLGNADGLLFGFPTRFGSMAAQMKAFFDSTHELWMKHKLAGVPAGFFVSTGTQGGGQETTAIFTGWLRQSSNVAVQLVHHGMLYVPIGYTFGAGMFKVDAIRGGSPYGGGVYPGDGTREPSETELALAEHQGKYMATIVNKFAHPL